MNDNAEPLCSVCVKSGAKKINRSDWPLLKFV